MVNECCLPSDVILRQPSDLSLTNHVHHFDSLKCSAGRVEGAESLTRSDPPFDASVILLDDIVQVAHRPAATASAEFTDLFQFGNCLR